MDPVQGSLRLPTTPLFGRAQELLHLRRLLTVDGARLVTLTGVGGAGKSRVAQAISQELSGRFDRAPSFVDLAPVRNPQLVPAAIAQALGVQESGTKAVPEILGELLRDGRSLLVLDNFEQVMDAALFVADLLARCAELVVVVTSREALGIRQEQVVHIQPLAVPDLQTALDLRATAQIPSVALFEERARARRTEFRLTEDNLREVAEICVRLDGIPLAIELAAAQTAVFPPKTILEQLKTSTPFVLGGPRDLPVRHQTLSAAIAWSYDLLEPDERAVFRWCGVFAGPFSAEAVQAVRSELRPAFATQATLAQLVTKSLVRLSDSATDVPRYELLDTLRAFALDRLKSAGELVDARQRYALYYVELAEHIQPNLRGAGMTEALARLSRDYANFREVFQWSSECDQLSVGLRLAGALYRFWLVRGHLAEAREWLEPALMRDSDSAPRIRGIALNAAGVLAGMQHDHARATAFFDQSLEVWKALGESARMADAHLNLGLVAHNVGDLAQAEVQFLRAEELFAEVEDRAGLGRAVGSLARLARENGDLERAISWFERCLELFREAKDDWGVANALHNIGNVRLALGDTRGAEDFFRQALEVRLRLGNVLGVAECLEGFAAAAAERRPGPATTLLGAAAALREQAGAPVPASEQGRYSETVDRVRLRQTNEAFARMWAAGRALTMDDAVALALRTPRAVQTLPDELAPARTDAAVRHLTRREREITELVALGRSNREIAEVLAVTLRTVESHLEHVFRKLTIKSRAELAVWAVQHGLAGGPGRTMREAR